MILSIITSIAIAGDLSSLDSKSGFRNIEFGQACPTKQNKIIENDIYIFGHGPGTLLASCGPLGVYEIYVTFPSFFTPDRLNSLLLLRKNLHDDYGSPQETSSEEYSFTDKWNGENIILTLQGGYIVIAPGSVNVFGTTMKITNIKLKEATKAAEAASRQQGF